MAVACALQAMCATGAFAQLAIPPELEPSRPEQNLEEGPRIKSSPRAFAPPTHKETAPENADATTFVFRQMTIEGAKAIRPEVLRDLWSAAPGAEASVADIFRFANAITRTYSQAGYALSFAIVPEQNIENGVVVVRVIEGFVERVEFTGAGADRLEGSALLRRVKKIAAKITHSRPLRTADLERHLLLANDLPGVEISSTLKPSPGTAGAAILVLDVKEREHIGAGLAYNNYMPESIGWHVAGVTASFHGGLTGTETISLSGWRSISSGAYWSASATGSLGIGDEGMRIGVSGLRSRSDPQTAFLEALEFLGETTTIGAFVSHPVIRGRTRNLIVGMSFSLTDIRSEILDAPLTRDRVRSAGISAAYDFADATRAVTYMRAGYERGLDILNASGNSRANGELEYNIATLEAQRTQPLFSALSGEVSAQLALRGQAAFGSGGLFNNAECAFGGRRFGRGYDAGVAIGDHCALGYAEISWRGRFGPMDAAVYGFGDGGYLWQKGTLEPGEVRRRAAASAGAGLRLQLTDHVSGVAETSWAVRPPDGAASTDNLRANAELRISF